VTRTIGIGVIGMGWMGDVHSRSYGLVRDRFHERGVAARLVACADVDRDRADLARDRFGFERSTTDWRSVIDDPAVEAVSITAPNDAHLEIIEAALAAGKHVACEKPVGRTPDETIEAAAAARGSGLVTLVGYNYRWSPMVRRARAILDAGGIGEMTHYRGRFLNGYAKDPNDVLSWRFRKELGYGTLSDLLSHAIDMALFLAGPIHEVVANRATFIMDRPLPRGNGASGEAAMADGTRGPVTNEDYVGALVRFRSGAQGTLEACRVITGPDCDLAFEANGRDGALAWTFERMNELRHYRNFPGSAADEGWTTELSGPSHPFHAAFNRGPGTGLGYDDLAVIELAEFLTAIVEGRPAIPSLDDAAAVAGVQLAIARSWDSGAWTTVSS
jgi:predicted dehydrogenase